MPAADSPQPFPPPPPPLPGCAGVTSGPSYAYTAAAACAMFSTLPFCGHDHPDHPVSNDLDNDLISARDMPAFERNVLAWCLQRACVRAPTFSPGGAQPAQPASDGADGGGWVVAWYHELPPPA